MSDKMREEFEAWCLGEFFDGSVEACGVWLNKDPVSGGYIYALPANQWKTWQASRAALAVELPESEIIDRGRDEAGNTTWSEVMDYDQTIEALTKAGVTVK